MSLTFEIFERAKNHSKKFLKLCQTSFRDIISYDNRNHSQRDLAIVIKTKGNAFITNHMSAFLLSKRPRTIAKNGDQNKTHKTFPINFVPLTITSV